MKSSRLFAHACPPASQPSIAPAHLSFLSQVVGLTRGGLGTKRTRRRAAGLRAHTHRHRSPAVEGCLLTHSPPATRRRRPLRPLPAPSSRRPEYSPGLSSACGGCNGDDLNSLEVCCSLPCGIRQFTPVPLPLLRPSPPRPASRHLRAIRSPGGDARRRLGRAEVTQGHTTPSVRPFSTFTHPLLPASR